MFILGDIFFKVELPFNCRGSVTHETLATTTYFVRT